MEFVLKDGRIVEIRPLQPTDDVFDLCRFINELIEEKSYIAMNEKITPESEAKWLENQIDKMRHDELIDFRAFLDGRCVGGAEARKGKWKERDNVELGIALSKEVRGQGLGRKLLMELIKEVKKKWKPKHIYLSVTEGNEPAKKLYEGLGFKEFARFPEWVNHYGVYKDKIWMEL